MKNVFLILNLFFIICFLSCSVEPITKTEKENTIENEDVKEEEIVEEELVTSTILCDYNLSIITANSTKKIDCILDLKGKTVKLPANVNLEFAGGDIINGKIIFSGGTIDYRLLNSKSKIDGEVTLSEPIFKLIPSRWEIKQGKVNNAVAKKNKDIIQDLIICTSNMKATTFVIDKLDAFFKVDVNSPKVLPQRAAITLPSNFTLKMSKNTHLRMQPNNFKRPTLLSIAEKITNTTIIGGTLHGDRDEHDYSGGGTHEWGHLLRISGCNNATVKGVTFMDATGDGVDVHGYGHSFASNYSPSRNILITGNTFIRNRRNNLSITDGRDIIVENNNFIDASIHTSKSKGVAPGFAIDVEAVRANGKIYEIAQDILIRNNREKGSRIGGFTVHTGDRVTFDGNTVENGISFSTSIGTVIKNNILKATTESEKNGGIGITAGRNDRFEKNFENKVFGNTVKGYAIGIAMTNTDLEVYDNTFINNKTGMTLETITNSKIYKNKVISTRKDSDGILSSASIDYIRDVIVENNDVKVPRTPFKFVNVNDGRGQKNFSLIIRKNISHSENTSTIINSHGLSFIENTIEEGGIRLADLDKGLIISKNNITSTVSNGIRIDAGCNKLIINNNIISVGPKFDCIKETTDDRSIESRSNNKCKD